MVVQVCNFGTIRHQDFYSVTSHERKAILHILELSTGPIRLANSFEGDKNGTKNFPNQVPLRHPNR